MIIVKDKGKNSKIYVSRTSIDSTSSSEGVDLTDYYTKEEVEDYVNEQINNIYIPETDLSDYYTKEEIEHYVEDRLTEFATPSLVVEYTADENYAIGLGSFYEVYNAILNKFQYFLFLPFGDTNDIYTNAQVVTIQDSKIVASIFIPTENGILKRTYYISDVEDINVVDSMIEYASTDYVDNKVDSINIPSLDGYATTDYVDNKVDSINIPSLDGYATTDYVDDNVNDKQDKLVSGENVKTINGNSILGSGDITIEGGGSGNIIELTQSEYDALPEKDSETLYLISDANVDANYKTINGESILGEGNIEILTNLDGYATTTYVDTQIGNINNILESIIG